MNLAKILILSNLMLLMTVKAEDYIQSQVSCKSQSSMDSSQFLANKIKVIIQKMNQDEIDRLVPIPSKKIYKDINRNQNDLDAELRIAEWIDLLKNEKYRKLNTTEKLEIVNNFFNKIPYESDNLTWRREDYWASPVEILSNNVADCEDYAVAKFLTLRKLGVPDEKLRLMIVKSSRFKAAHMILTYRENKDAVPLILDNNNREIISTTDKHFFLPLYSLSNKNTWKVDYKSDNWKEAEKIGGNHSKWTELKSRLRKGQ